MSTAEWLIGALWVLVALVPYGMAYRHRVPAREWFGWYGAYVLRTLGRWIETSYYGLFVAIFVWTAPTLFFPSLMVISGLIGVHLMAACGAGLHPRFWTPSNDT